MRGMAGALAVLLGRSVIGTSGAKAADGDPLVLGQVNKSRSTTTLNHRIGNGPSALWLSSDAQGGDTLLSQSIDGGNGIRGTTTGGSLANSAGVHGQAIGDGDGVRGNASARGDGVRGTALSLLGKGVSGGLGMGLGAGGGYLLFAALRN
jgi:hypothetical protein